MLLPYLSGLWGPGQVLVPQFPYLKMVLQMVLKIHADHVSGVTDDS